MPAAVIPRRQGRDTCPEGYIPSEGYGLGRCVKKRTWMENMQKVGDNPLWVFNYTRAIEKELLDRDRPDPGYLREKVTRLSKWLDEVDQFGGS